MKIALLTSALLLGLCAYLGLKDIDATMGGGITKQSPSKEYTLNLSSLKNTNPLAGENEIYSEITIHQGGISGEVIKTITVSPIQENSEMSYRSLENPIVWKEDNSAATITTPDFTITVNMNPDPIGIGLPITEKPSHTTTHTGP